MKRVVIASGYFNPLHMGHLEMLNLSKSHGDFLIVIVNNDIQRSLKGSKYFMDEMERLEIIKNINVVDRAFLSVDVDRSVLKSLKRIISFYGDEYEYIFVNGGDQFFSESPERDFCIKNGLKMLDGLGDKIQSSSSLLSR